MKISLLEFFCLESEDDDQKGLPSNPFDPPGIKAKKSKPSSPGLRIKPQDRVMNPARTDVQKRSIPNARLQKPQAKPGYRGNFLGQTWTTNTQTISKPVSWKDRQSGDTRYGSVPSMQKTTMVWNGDDWVTKQEFDTRFGKK